MRCVELLLCTHPDTAAHGGPLSTCLRRLASARSSSHSNWTTVPALAHALSLASSSGSDDPQHGDGPAADCASPAQVLSFTSSVRRLPLQPLLPTACELGHGIGEMIARTGL
jgi:hypothetical protein